MAAGSITDADVADLVQRCRNAAAALIRGDMRNYLGLFVHSDDYTLLPPYGGGPRHGFDASDQAIEDMSRFFAGGEAQVELVQSVGGGPSGVRTDRDQTDTMQHADRVVPAQTNHVRHCHLPGNRDRACSHEPAPDEWLPTSGQRPVVSRALHHRCQVRRDRIERTAHRALYRASPDHHDTARPDPMP